MVIIFRPNVLISMNIFSKILHILGKIFCGLAQMFCVCGGLRAFATQRDKVMELFVMKRNLFIILLHSHRRKS